VGIDPSAKVQCGASISQGREVDMVLPKGSRLMINEVEVSHADMGERYTITSKSEFGRLVLISPEDASFDGLKLLSEDDLRYPYFYYPSLLMYWPVEFFVLLDHISSFLWPHL
jgi:hypothetical protein